MDELLLPVGEGAFDEGRWGGGADRIFHQGAGRVIDKRVRVTPACDLCQRRVNAQVLEPAAGGKCARLVLCPPLQAGGKPKPGLPIAQVGGLGEWGHRQERRGKPLYRARVTVPFPHQVAGRRDEVKSVEGHTLWAFLF